ncbi:MAG: helix-turn-helix domain-containing protein [Alteraurantiacibacter sp.]
MRRDIPATGELTPPNRFTLDYVEPEGDLAQLVTTFYHFRCEDALVRDIQPAAIGHIALFPRGNGHMARPDGGFDPSHEVVILSPFAKAMPFVVDGPFHAVGAALTPLGWAALTGLDASEHANRLYPAAEWLPDEFVAQGQALCSAYRKGDIGAAEIHAALGAFIAGHAAMPPPQHLLMMKVVGEWLASDLVPDMDALYAASGFSKRQTQRLVQRYFGSTPVALRRKYRALRAAAMLSQPDLPNDVATSVLDSFYDQPHMIREIREFVGRTPARLADPQTPYLSELTHAKNLRELGR